jgi:hypothetical protein
MQYLRIISFVWLTIIAHANAMEEQEFFPTTFRSPDGLSCSAYLARIPCINLETPAGEKFPVPEAIALQSPLWARKHAAQQPIVLPEQIIGIVTELLAAAHIKKDLPLHQLLDAIYQEQMKGDIERAFCTSKPVRIPLYYASFSLPLVYTYEDTLYQKILIETLEGCSSHPLLAGIIAYTLSRQSWKTFYDPAKVYRHLLSKSAYEAAIEVARYSYLSKNVCLRETLGRISTEEPSRWNYYRDTFSPTTLEVPVGSCTFTLEEYLHFKAPLLIERKKEHDYKLDHLILGSLAGLDALENIRSVQQLDLSYNYLTALSPFFTVLVQLKTLNLSHNRFGTLPCLRLPNLESLDVSHNQLTSLREADLDQLRNLQQIDTRNNLVPLPVTIIPS